MNDYCNNHLLLILISLAVAITACVSIKYDSNPTPVEILGPPSSDEVNVVLQRLEVEYLGLDGHKVIGSGCPGNDRKGTIDNYHFVVNGVDTNKNVYRVLVAGDNSTLTWAWPCSDNWALIAQNMDEGMWEIFIAQSLPTQMYTIIFFYDDNTMAIGMVDVE